jgi:DNA segregation ATPase FtsK/SpoIIIE-like protein
MSGTRVRSAMASYRDAVAELFEAGEPFSDIEVAIDEVVDLSMEEKAALWLFAFSLRDQSDQRRGARAHLVGLP